MARGYLPPSPHQETRGTHHSWVDWCEDDVWWIAIIMLNGKRAGACAPKLSIKCNPLSHQWPHTHILTHTHTHTNMHTTNMNTYTQAHTCTQTTHTYTVHISTHSQHMHTCTKFKYKYKHEFLHNVCVCANICSICVRTYAMYACVEVRMVCACVVCIFVNDPNLWVMT